MLLEVLLAGSAELDSSKLEAAVLEAGDDGTNEATLGAVSTLLIYYGRPLRLQWPVVLYLPGRHQA